MSKFADGSKFVNVLTIVFKESAPLVVGTRLDDEGMTYEVTNVQHYATGGGVATALPVAREIAYP